MDFYFRSYPKDQNIFLASVDLVFATFKAAEQAVRFYISVQGEPLLGRAKEEEDKEQLV